LEGWSKLDLAGLINKAQGMSPSLTIDPSLTFEFELPKQGAAYWQSISKGAGWPKRRDVNPASIARLLPHITLIDVFERDAGEVDLYGRLAGQELERIFGKIGGKNLREKFSYEQYLRWEVFARALLVSREPIRIETQIAHKDQTFLMGEFFVGPLQDHEGATMTILGFAEFKPL